MAETTGVAPMLHESKSRVLLLDDISVLAPTERLELST